MIQKLLLYRKPLLIAVGMLIVGLALGLANLRVSFSFENFYPKNDQEFIYYSEFKKIFAQDQNYAIYLALKSPQSDVFDQQFLSHADSVFGSIEGLEGVDTLISGTKFPLRKLKGLSMSDKPYLEFDTQEEVEKSRQRVMQDSVLLGSFISRDQQYICAFVFMERGYFDGRKRDLLNNQIKSAVTDSGYEFVLSGIPFIRTQYIEKIAWELGLFITLSLILIVTVLFLTYRNFWAVLVPMGTVVLSLLAIMGFMGGTGGTINLISNLLIPIMFVVGTSDIIHLNTKFLHEIKLGKDKATAIQITLREIGLSILLTSITTSIGFGSLLISKVPPIRDLGMYAAVGVMLTFVISIVIIPNALFWLNKNTFDNKKSIENLKIWDRFFLFLARFNAKYTKRILLAFGVILVLCIGLIFRIPLDTYLIEDISKNDPIRHSMEFFEKQAYGMRAFELGIHVKGDAKVTDVAVLKEMEKIEKWLAKNEHFSPFLSISNLVSEGNYLYHRNRRKYKRVPDTQEEVDDLIAFMELNGGTQFLGQVMDKDRKIGRISARIPDIGTSAFERLIQGLDEYMAVNGNSDLLEYRPTGHAFLTEHNLMYIRSSLMWGLGLAFLIIGGIMGFLFRSWKMLFISMFPNVIPLIFTGGVMGLFGIPLTASTAIVFVIAFGIAVDDTIHFLNRYRLERNMGRSVDASIRNTLMGTGKAILLTSFILLGGFITLLTSDFGGTFNTGLFTGLTIVFALFADLILLPILLRMFDSDKGD